MSLFGTGKRRPAVAPGPALPTETMDATELRAAAQENLQVADRDRRKAYDAGRADERAKRRRGGHPLLPTLLLLVAVIGVVWLVLAWREGSFAGGGAVVDQKLSQTAEPGKQALRNAADRSGDALQNAGKALERQGDKLKKAAP